MKPPESSVETNPSGPMTQPLAPSISMRWYFVIATVVAVLVVWALRSGGSQLGIVFGLIFGALLFYFLISGICFLVAFLLGFLRAYSLPTEVPQSPFATESLPPQILPPQARE